MFRLPRVAPAALLLTVSLFIVGAHPTMAQTVIDVDTLNPLAPPQEAGPAADVPPSAATHAEGEPAGNATPEASAPEAAPNAAPGTYVVQANDTMYSIARRHGVSIDAILWANGLMDPNVLKQGQTLTIPPSSGTLYTVKAGDSLASVSQANGVSATGIATANGLAEEASLVAGQRLLVPAPRQAVAPDAASAPVTVAAAQVASPAPLPTSPAAPSPSSTSVSTESALVGAGAPLAATDSLTASPDETPSATVTIRRLPKLEWPLSLKPPTIVITQRFRPGHRGVDVGAPAGTPIKAMATGVVKRAEKGDNGGYGWLVVVDHGEGITTWYAHLSEISVSVGDKIQMGQKLGAAGSTGRSTGPHLHFEVRVGDTRLDPLVVLPK